MKKILIGLFLGFVLHMLYLDFIAIRQHQIIDECISKDTPDENGDFPCLEYGNSTHSRYYGKYFGIYYLIKWDNIVTGPWRLE